MERIRVFYSWASDHPNDTNRSFIERALQRALQSVRSDQSARVEPVIDRDSHGISGAPDITSSVFAKIDQAYAFVCDVSIIDGSARKPTANPNVLVELGYALKAFTSNRVILVMNTAYGPVELLPFDLRTRRVVSYYLTPDNSNQAHILEDLTSNLTEQLRGILKDRALQPSTLAQAAVEGGKSSQVELVRSYMETLGKEIATHMPGFDDNDSRYGDEQLIEAINACLELTSDFTNLASAIASANATDSAHVLYKGFSHILDLFQSSRSQPDHVGDFDLPRFLGHELFVTFVACLMRTARWDLLADLLASKLYVNNTSLGETGLVNFTALSELVRLLVERNNRLQLNRRLLHADILEERHSGDSRLALKLPFNDFTAGDYFLFLRGQLHSAQAPTGILWKPWSVANIANPPRFLIESRQTRVANQISHALGLTDVDTFRIRLAERAPALRRYFLDPNWNDPIKEFPSQDIGIQ